ncbi:MAG TPA: DUF72 domain-containing protein [Acidimicrobiales bacterium]|nr:DUF72 domain-containing protein [Acidimicrobiales bacterium]
MTSAEERLQYYSARFPLVEVDSTYYFMPAERNAELWIERTPEHFVFHVKAFSLMTLHPTKAEAIPKGLPRPEGKARLYPKDLDSAVVDEVWDRFLSAVRPLHAAGRMGAILFQFPPWFGINRDNKQYLLECSRRCGDLPICVEFRNSSWLSERNQAETVEFLEGYGLPLVCVDMPQGFRSSLPPLVAATAGLAVVRFHGRNAEEWESGSVQRRFRYLYSDEELAEWVPKISSLAEQAERTHVLMNNCYADYAPRNAAQLADLLRREGVTVA